jgi:hypothetical protein
MKRLLAIAVALCFTLAPSPMFAQAVGTITGVVTDESAAGVPGVTIDVTNSATGQVRTAVTAADGYYAVRQLPPGP